MGGAAGTGGTSGGGGSGGAGGVSGLPARAAVIDLLRRANTYFVNKWPDPGARIDSTHDSHIWTRAVYYEGLMGLNAVDPQASYVDYAVRWGTSHSWGIVGGTTTRSADNQCAGQTYIDLYNMDAQADAGARHQGRHRQVVAGTALTTGRGSTPSRWRCRSTRVSGMLWHVARTPTRRTRSTRHEERQGGNGLYNKTDHLWWRDPDFDPPYVEPNGKNCYWSRGNGWVYAALVRVLDISRPRSASRRVPRRFRGDVGGAARGAAHATGSGTSAFTIPRISAARS